MWGSRSLERFGGDLRYAGRQMLRNPGFTAVAVFTLALGIGGTTAIFSVVNAVVLRPLPYVDPDRLVWITEASIDGQEARAPGPHFLEWGERSSLEQIGAYVGGHFTLTGAGDPERLSAIRASSGFLPMLGVTPLLGRHFLPEEDRPGAERVVMLGYGLIDPGYRFQNLLTMRVTLPEARYPQRSHLDGFYVDLLERVSSLPGVQAAAATNHLPLERLLFRGWLRVPGRSAVSRDQLPEDPPVPIAVVSPEYFRTMGVPLRAGRGFSDGDHADSPRVRASPRQAARTRGGGYRRVLPRLAAVLRDDDELALALDHAAVPARLRRSR